MQFTIFHNVHRILAALAYVAPSAPGPLTLSPPQGQEQNQASSCFGFRALSGSDPFARHLYLANCGNLVQNTLAFGREVRAAETHLNRCYIDCKAPARRCWRYMLVRVVSPMQASRMKMLPNVSRSHQLRIASHLLFSNHRYYHIKIYVGLYIYTYCRISY